MPKYPEKVSACLVKHPKKANTHLAQHEAYPERIVAYLSRQRAAYDELALRTGSDRVARRIAELAVIIELSKRE